MFARFSYPVHVYRKGANTWGDAPEAVDAPMPVLYDRPYHHTIENAVVAPRVSEDLGKAPHNMPLTSTGKNLYCDPSDDIRADDYIMYTDHSGRKQAYKVDGEGDGDFVSPYTNTVGGKEVQLVKINHRRGR